MLTRALAARLLRRDLGGAWRVANGSGSHGNMRRAASGDVSVVVVLGSPAATLRRLAELGVTPPVLAWGVHDGRPTRSSGWRRASTPTPPGSRPTSRSWRGSCGATSATSGWPLDDALMARILWWAGFKALRNAYSLDRQGAADRAAIEVRGVVRAMARHRGA